MLCEKWSCPDLRIDSKPPTDNPFDKPVPEGAARTVSAVLGEIVWLMSQSPLHKQFFISDLEWFVMAPVMLQQFRLYYQDAPVPAAPDAPGGRLPAGESPGANIRRPIGVTFWAFVSNDVEQMLANGTTRMRPQDWKSGDRAWVVEVIAPFGGAEAMVSDLKTKVFANRELRVLTLKDGKREVKVL